MAADCADCPVRGRIHCHFRLGDLAHFLAIGLPGLLVGGAGVLGAGVGHLVFWVALMVGFYYLFPEAAFDLVIRAERGVGGLAHNTADVGELHFAYLEGGRGEPLVLLHGFGANKDNWTRIGRHLTPHFRLIAPDLVGVGESGPA